MTASALRYILNAAAVTIVLTSTLNTLADVAAVTVLADFEDASVAARIGDVHNVLAGDCKVYRNSIPARGQGSLALQIGATRPGASVSCDLTFRQATRFDAARRIAAFCWISDAAATVSFQLRDDRDQLFETTGQTVKLRNQWVYIVADLESDDLQRIHGDGPLTPPFQISGYRVRTNAIGTQTVYLDDLQVEHRVPPHELVRVRFIFSGTRRSGESSRIYQPGQRIPVSVVLENRSRARALPITVDLTWLRPDDTVLHTDRGSVRLPESGIDFRARREIDSSLRVEDPGLYRLRARVRAAGWNKARTTETTVAVAPAGDRLSRGRSTFFTVRTNLLREPEIDQRLELEVARDIGVNQLAIQMPWRRIEPKPDNFDFRLLDDPVDYLISNGMAVMLVLTEAPDHAPTDPTARSRRLINVLVAASSYFGDKVQLLALGDGVLATDVQSTRLTQYREVRTRFREIRSNVDLLSPPLAATEADARTIADLLDRDPDLPIVFETAGDSANAIETLAALRRRGGFKWTTAQWWQHNAKPLAGAGYYHNAEQVLRHHVAAAEAGVGGLIWFDLRDDDNDPAHRFAQRGLVRRDFSPRTTLLGYATTAGQLTGHRYAGRVLGTPDAFDSAIFLGSQRQVGVMLPRPNRVRPALVMPISGVQGEYAAEDFERRPYPVLRSSAPALILTADRPWFILLQLKQPDPDPQLGLAEPWLRVPATAFAGPETTFTIAIDALANLRRSYLQLRIPGELPVNSDFSARGLRAERGETITQEVQLRPETSAEFNTGEILLRLSLESDTIDIPLTCRRLTQLHRTTDRDIGVDRFQIGQLAPPAGMRPTARATIHAGWTGNALRVALRVDDDSFVSVRGATGPTTSGDQLLLGIAWAGSDEQHEIAIDPALDDPVIRAVFGTEPTLIDNWQCDATQHGGTRTYLFTIPWHALAADASGTAGQHLLLAARYTDDDADGYPPIPLVWGNALTGQRSTAGYHWLVLTP